MSLLTADEIKAMRATSLRQGAATFWALAEEVAAEYGVQARDFAAEGRGPLLLNEARQMLCMVAMDRGITSGAIGRFLHRDHSTVLHAAMQARRKVASPVRGG